MAQKNTSKTENARFQTEWTITRLVRQCMPLTLQLLHHNNSNQLTKATDQQIVPTSTAMSITSEQTWNCSESSGAESAAIASFVYTSNKYSFTAPDVCTHSRTHKKLPRVPCNLNPNQGITLRMMPIMMINCTTAFQKSRQIKNDRLLTRWWQQKHYFVFFLISVKYILYKFSITTIMVNSHEIHLHHQHIYKLLTHIHF